MAGLTKQTNASNDIFGKACSNSGKSPSDEDVSIFLLLKKVVEVAA
jgi:hypothetical protein